MTKGKAKQIDKRNKAIFLDRDGTIIEDRDYLSSPDEIKLLSGSAKAVKMINELGFKAVVVTNQSGVARGIFPEEQVEVIHRRLEELLRAKGARIDAFYYCPHHPTEGKGRYRTECLCRKPETGMIDAAVRDFYLDPSQSYVIGDKLIDIELAQRAGAGGILVKTGYGRKEIQSLSHNSTLCPIHIAEDILGAVEWIKLKLKGSVESE